jgi:hypothetical protein
MADNLESKGIKEDEVSNLVKHAEKELKLAGLFDKDSDYDGMLGEAVLELVKVFSKQGHSGFSAHQTLKIFNIVADYKPLTPIGKSKDEWMNVSENCDGYEMWQNKRRGTTFSRDGGKTWYDIDDPKLNNGDVWSPSKIRKLAKRLHLL